MKGTTIVVVLLVAMGGVLVYGCLTRQPPRASPLPRQIAGSPVTPRGTGMPVAQTTSPGRSLGPPPEPGPLAGEYTLTAGKLSKPWWREICGSLASRGPGLYEGTIDRSGKEMKARLELTGEGAAGKARLALDLDGDGKLNDKPVASVATRVTEDGTTRLVLPPVKGSDGKPFALGIEAKVSTRAAGVNVYRLVTEYLSAKPLPGKADPKLRFLPADPGAHPAAAYWRDADGDGAVSAGEAASGSAAGIAGRLYNLTFSGPGPDKAVLAGFPGGSGTLQLQATDGRGQPIKVSSLTLGTPVGNAGIPGPVDSTEAPASDCTVSYGFPVSDEVEAEVNVSRPVRVSSGSTTTIQVGGPVKLDLDVSSGRESILDASADKEESVRVTAKLTTQTGHEIRSITGPGEHGGVVELVDQSGKVLATGKLEFG